MKTYPFAEFDNHLLWLLRWQRIVFGSWAAINVFTAVFFLSLAEGIPWYFGLMNFTWGIVNFGVLWLLYLHTRAARFINGDRKERDWVQRHLTSLLLLNVGLDCLYVFAGTFLLGLGDNSATTEMASLRIGFGISVLIQGSFLSIQDLFFCWLHVRNLTRNWPDQRASNDDKNQSEA